MSVKVNITQARKHLLVAFPELSWTIGSAILLLVPGIVIGNGFVLASILLDPFKNIRSSSSNNLIFNLALADFLVGILVAPLAAVWYISVATKISGPFPINILAFTAFVTVGASFYTLIALSVDRQIAITTPLKYRHKVTNKKLRSVNLLCQFWTTFNGT